jgi:neutral ceramidase
VLGAAFAAGTKEGPGAKFCNEGVDGNRLLFACCRVAYRIRPGLGDAQSPKALLVPVGALGWTADRLPIQLVRIGSLVLIALAQEVTIVAGLRLRRAVAELLDLPLDNVLVQGYANDYAGYLTTPEEYDAQRYEGGHTMFGRWQLPAYLQEVVRVATDLRDNRPTARGQSPDDRPPKPTRSQGKRMTPPPCRCTGVVRQPADAYAAGDVVHVEFTVTDPRARLLPSYFVVERRDGSEWHRSADDGDWSTRIEWQRADDDAWTAAVSWEVPPDAKGTHRISYLDASSMHPTREFAVT